MTQKLRYALTHDDLGSLKKVVQQIIDAEMAVDLDEIEDDPQLVRTSDMWTDLSRKYPGVFA